MELLTTTEEMEETMFNLTEHKHRTEAQLQTQTMDVVDTSIPMDSHNSNITHQQHLELQDVADLLAEVEATVNTVLTTANPCISNSHNNTTISTDGETCQQQVQMQAQALLQHNRLLQTPPSSVSPHLPQT